MSRDILSSADSLTATTTSDELLGIVAAPNPYQDIGQAGVIAPTMAGGWPSTSALTMVAGTEYSARAVIPRPMKIKSVSFVVRVAGGANDTVYVTVRDQFGTPISSGSGTPTLTSTGRKTVNLTTPVQAAVNDILYLSILIPTFASTAPGLVASNPATSLHYQLWGGTVGNVDALSKASQSTPQTTLNQTDTTFVCPFLMADDAWGLPLRNWQRDPNATTFSPFTWVGFDQPNQISFDTTTVRTPNTRSAKFTVRPGDVQPATSSGGERSELADGSPGTIALDDTHYYSLSFYLPTDYTAPTELLQGNTATWTCFAQWHINQISPPLSIGPNNNQVGSLAPGLYAFRVAGEINVGGTWVNNSLNPLYVEQVRLCDLTLGVWHDFVVRANWASSLTGNLDIWHRITGQKGFTRVLSRRNVATTTKNNGTADSAAISPYYKLGLYRSASTNTQTVYHAGGRRGVTLSDVLPLFGDPSF